MSRYDQRRHKFLQNPEVAEGVSFQKPGVGRSGWAMVPAKESSDKDPDESLVGRECMVELMGVGQG